MYLIIPKNRCFGDFFSHWRKGRLHTLLFPRYLCRQPLTKTLRIACSNISISARYQQRQTAKPLPDLIALIDESVDRIVLGMAVFLHIVVVEQHQRRRVGFQCAARFSKKLWRGQRGDELVETSWIVPPCLKIQVWQKRSGVDRRGSGHERLYLGNYFLNSGIFQPQPLGKRLTGPARQ